MQKITATKFYNTIKEYKNNPTHTGTNIYYNNQRIVSGGAKYFYIDKEKGFFRTTHNGMSVRIPAKVVFTIEAKETVPIGTIYTASWDDFRAEITILDEALIK